MKSIVSVRTCKTYDLDQIQKALDVCFSDIGGLESIIKNTDTVFLKPNLLSDSDPALCITTHPEFVRAVIKKVKSIGARPVVGDSCADIGVKMEDVYRKTGIKKVCEQEETEYVFFDSVLDWKIPLARVVLQSDVIINLPKFKTHNLTLFTGGIKNMFGIVPGAQKMCYHRDYPRVNEFSKLLVEVFAKARPHLTILDGIRGLEGEGPGSSGKPKDIGLILCSRDTVALDTVVAFIMGLDLKTIPMLKIASEAGLGNTKMDDIKIIADKPLEPIKDFILPTSGTLSKIPGWIIKLAGNFINIRPIFNKRLCSKCGICIKGCPKGAISIKAGFPRLNMKKCISCLCCQEFCPSSAVRVKFSIKFS
jgi:uncharacterized protein (DUF362 family)/Pyruvate/2-oxoacid:ferredoxin oxidoreductase delta subunit